MPLRLTLIRFTVAAYVQRSAATMAFVALQTTLAVLRTAGLSKPFPRTEVFVPDEE